ncbi:MAG: hypothetical protein M3Q49_06535 [Actinomycetota bacterium]|nr:hypothetical protein [Actinomycetota bacterium]
MTRLKLDDRAYIRKSPDAADGEVGAADLEPSVHGTNKTASRFNLARFYNSAKVRAHEPLGWPTRGTSTPASPTSSYL